MENFITRGKELTIEFRLFTNQAALEWDSQLLELLYKHVLTPELIFGIFLHQGLFSYQMVFPGDSWFFKP